MPHELKPKPDWLKPMYPWEQHAITVNGRTMSYLDEGDEQARPVLLLHGNPTWSFLYRDFIEPLGRWAGLAEHGQNRYWRFIIC